MHLETNVRQKGKREFRTVPLPDNQGVGGNYHYDYLAPPMRGRC